VMDVLGKRLGRFGLALHPEKTRLLPFRRPPAGQQRGKGPATFDFLGFTLYWASSRKGRWGMLCKTRSASLRRLIHSVYVWCRRHRHSSVKDQHMALTRRIQGTLQLLRRQRQLQKLVAGDRAGEAYLVQVALPPEPTQASHLGAVRGSASRLPAPSTPAHRSDLGRVATSRISGGAGWWKSPCPDLERARDCPGLLDSWVLADVGPKYRCPLSPVARGTPAGMETVTLSYEELDRVGARGRSGHRGMFVSHGQSQLVD
jgi:hypothetical protein